MYRLPSCAERVPPTWLALGLDQGPSSLLPRGTSFGRSVQPRPPGTEERPICAGEGSSHPGSAWARPRPQLLQTATHSRCSVVTHAGTAVPRYVSRRSTCITASGLSRFRRTTTRPLSNTLVMRAGPNHGNCSFVPRVRSSVMSWIHTSSPAWYSRLWTLPS